MVGRDDGTIQVWETATYIQVHNSHNPCPDGMGFRYAVASLAYSPDGRMLASGCQGGSIGLWDVVTMVLLNTMHDGIQVYTLVFAMDSTRIIWGSPDQKLRVWDTTGANPVQEVEGLEYNVASLSMTNDRTRLVGCCDNNLCVWEIPPSAGLNVAFIGSFIYHICRFSNVWPY